MDLKFNKDCLFVSFEVVGDSNVDIVGYVTGLDGQKLLSLKEAMELPDASDDEDYKEEGESEEKEDSKEEEEEESESDEEIATPLASKRIVPLSSMDEAAASNRSTLSHSFNTECISYYKKRL